MHPSLPAIAGSSISFGQFHGLTAVSPTFSFSNVALSNGSMTASNGTLLVSGSAGASNALAGSIYLSNYLNSQIYNAPVTFALSNGMTLPTGTALGSNGTLSHSILSAVTSSTNVIATNRWGNIAYVSLSYNIADAVLFSFLSLSSRRLVLQVSTDRLWHNAALLIQL